MTRIEFENQLISVAAIQRKAGWHENGISLYADEQREISLDDNGDPFSCILMVGAGLACNNSRFGISE